MFDLGWTELMVIGIVALIVVGPKDLPGMFRTVGQFVGKAKGMAREFSKAMNDAADESGMREVSDSLRKATNPVGSAMDEVRKSAKSFTQATRDAGKPALKPDPGQDEATGTRDKTAGEKALEAHARDAEAAKKKADEPASKPAAKSTAKAKAPAKKAATKKPAAAKKTSAKSTSKKPAAKKPAPKPRTSTTPAAKKPAPKPRTSTKPAAKKPAATKAAGRKKTPNAAAKSAAKDKA